MRTVTFNSGRGRYLQGMDTYTTRLTETVWVSPAQLRIELKRVRMRHSIREARRAFWEWLRVGGCAYQAHDRFKAGPARFQINEKVNPEAAP